MHYIGIIEAFVFVSQIVAFLLEIVAFLPQIVACFALNSCIFA